MKTTMNALMRSITIKSITFSVACAISAFSAIAIADRPAMQSRPASLPAQSESSNVASPRYTDNQQSQSSVELMMQQEAGTVLQTLPAKEIQPGETIAITTLDGPRRGASMNKVENLYGQPVDIKPAVGTPPITTWTYDDRIVYFEHQRVVHVVAKK